MIQRALPLLLSACVFILGCGAEKAPSKREGEASAGTVSVQGTPVRLQDASGRILSLVDLPNRILSLVPSGSETLLAIGAGDRLVGRTDFDEVQGVAHLPSVGGGLHPNLEAILALDPHLVIRFADGTDKRTPLRLDEMGIPHFSIDPKSIESVRGIIRDLGILTGNTEEASTVLEAMDASLQSVRDRVRGRKRLKVAYILGGGPPWVAGPGSFIDDLLTVAGGDNAFADLDQVYGPVNAEAFLAREIDLLMAAEGWRFLGRDWLKPPSSWPGPSTPKPSNEAPRHSSPPSGGRPPQPVPQCPLGSCLVRNGRGVFDPAG